MIRVILLIRVKVILEDMSLCMYQLVLQINSEVSYSQGNVCPAQAREQLQERECMFAMRFPSLQLLQGIQPVATTSSPLASTSQACTEPVFMLKANFRESIIAFLPSNELIARLVAHYHSKLAWFYHLVW